MCGQFFVILIQVHFDFTAAEECEAHVKVLLNG